MLAGPAPTDREPYPLALGCLKAYADAQAGLKHRVSVALASYPLDPPAPDAVAADLLSRAPDLVGFSCYVWNFEFVSQVAPRIRFLRPGVKVVLGGPHASALPEECLRRGLADFVVRGEGEETFAELLERLACGAAAEDVPGLAWLDRGRPVVNPDRPSLSDLDRLPCPYRAGVLRPDPGYGGYVALETCRGCPHDCAFCTWTQKNRVRFFSAERVLATAKRLVEAAPKAVFFVTDSDFFLRPDRAKAILSGLRRLGRGNSAEWSFECHPSRVDKELARLADWDRFRFAVGVESLAPRTLRLAHRPCDLERLKSRYRLFRRSAPRARIHIQLMLGLPGDTAGVFVRGLDWALSSKPDLVDVFRLQLLPGTLFRRGAADLGIRFDRKPPFKVRSTPLFPERDVERAAYTTFIVSFLWSCPAVRKALAAVLSGRKGRLSWVAACEAIASRLESSGSLSLAEVYRRWLRSDGRQANPITVTWPMEVDRSGQLAVLRAAAGTLRGLGSPAVSGRADAILAEAAGRLFLNAVLEGPDARAALACLGFGPSASERTLVVGWKHGRPMPSFGPGEAVVLLTDSARREVPAVPRPPELAEVDLGMTDGPGRLAAVLGSDLRGFDRVVLVAAASFLARPERVRLFGSLRAGARSSARLLVAEALPGPGRPGLAAMLQDAAEAGWEALAAPVSLETGSALRPGQPGGALLLSLGKAGRGR